MIRRSTRVAVAVGLALALAGCGVRPEDEPEPLPASFPAVQPPSVTQEPTPTTSGAGPAAPPTSSARR